MYVFHNIINFYIEQRDSIFTALRYTHFLFSFRENLSHSYTLQDDDLKFWINIGWFGLVS